MKRRVGRYGRLCGSILLSLVLALGSVPTQAIAEAIEESAAAEADSVVETQPADQESARDATDDNGKGSTAPETEKPSASDSKPVGEEPQSNSMDPELQKAIADEITAASKLRKDLSSETESVRLLTTLYDAVVSLVRAELREEAESEPAFSLAEKDTAKELYRELAGGLQEDASSFSDFKALRKAMPQELTKSSLAEAFAAMVGNLGIEHVEVTSGEASWLMVEVDDAWYHVDSVAAILDIAKAKRDARESGDEVRRRDVARAWLLVSDGDVRSRDDARQSWRLVKGDGELPIAEKAYAWHVADDKTNGTAEEADGQIDMGGKETNKEASEGAADTGDNAAQYESKVEESHADEAKGGESYAGYSNATDAQEGRAAWQRDDEVADPGLLGALRLQAQSLLGRQNIQGSTPVLFNNNTAIRGDTVSLGHSHSAAIKTDGSLWTWGYGANGELGGGDNYSGVARYTPAKVMDGVAAISLGSSCSAAIKSDGSLWTWGWNEHGQLGDGTITVRRVPAKIMDGVVAVSLGGGHSAAIKSDGSLWMWGYNCNGQLGDGTFVDRPTPVKVMDDVVAISLGHNHSAAIKSDGSLWTWGYHNSGLGYHSGADRSVPTKVMDGVTAVSLGGFHSAAIESDGDLWLWGPNSSGDIGDGTTTDTFLPKLVMNDVTAVSLGEYHSAAIRSDGSLWIWGGNASGEIGDGGGMAYSNPVKVMDGVAAVSLGVYRSAAIKSDGSLWAWGTNYYGQVGDGTITDRHTPVKIMDNVALSPADIKTPDQPSEHVAFNIEGANVYLNGEHHSKGCEVQATGKAVEPELSVYCDDGESAFWPLLTRDVDYTVTFSENVAPGTAFVKIVGKGRYHGEKTVTFTITENPEDNYIVKRVHEYTSGDLYNEYDQIASLNLPMEEKFQYLNEFFTNKGFLNPQDGYAYLSQTTPARRSYDALVCGDQFIAHQYQWWLDNTAKGWASRGLLIADDYIFNAKYADYLDIPAMLQAETPNVKKCKDLLYDFLSGVGTDIKKAEFVTFLSNSAKTAGKMTDAGKLYANDLIKRINEAKTEEELKKLADKLKSSDISVHFKKSEDGQYRYQLSEVSGFGKQAKKTKATAGVIGVAVQEYNDLMDIIELDANMECYLAYQDFLTEVMTSPDLPLQLRTAASIVKDEIDEGPWGKVRDLVFNLVNGLADVAGVGTSSITSELLKTAKTKVLGEAAAATVASWISAVQLAAWGVNMITDVGSLAKGSDLIEGYEKLCDHYANNLRNDCGAFRSNASVENAWKFYEDYNLLWLLRVHGEKAYYKMQDIGGLTKIFIQNGLELKRDAVNASLASLEGHRFVLDETADTPDSAHFAKYSSAVKLVVDCPVDIDVFAPDGSKVATMADGAESEVTNEHGTFTVTYRPWTGEWAKAAFVGGAGYRFEAHAHDKGLVSAKLMSGDGWSTVKSVDNIPVVDKSAVELVLDDSGTNMDCSSDFNGDGWFETKVSTHDQPMANREPQVQGITLWPNKLNIAVGKSEVVEVSTQPTDAENKSVRWVSLDESVATVANGKVTGMGEGTTKVLCVSLDNTDVIAECQVVVRATSIFHALLYSNGELVLQRDANPDQAKGEPAEAWEVDEMAEILDDYKDLPWYNNVHSYLCSSEGHTAITKVTIADTLHPISTAYWFSGDTIREIEGLENLDTSQTKSMRGMFKGSKLEELDLSALSVSNVRDMFYMFYECKFLKSLEASNWETSSVYGTNQMFYNCNSLETLDVSSWDMSKVQNMNSMFCYCKKLREIDVSKWVTSSVSIMTHVFTGCEGLESLDVSHWDTSNATEMFWLFRGCNSLRAIDVAKWDTSNVIYMNNVFDGCTSLESLDLSGWDTSSVETSREMIANCPSLQSLTVGEKFTVSNVIPDSPEMDNKWWSVSERRWIPTEEIRQSRAGIADTYRTYATVDLSTATVASIPGQTYTGKALTPKPVVTVGDKTLTEGTDYTLSYANNVNVGTATVTFAGKGNYAGTKSAIFSIARAKVAVPAGANRTYNGMLQTGVAAGAGYSLSGTWRATDADVYTAYATPDANHCWPDGSTERKAINWRISVPAAHVAYRTHVQSFGWQGFVRDGAMSGTSGKAKRLEGINIKLESPPVPGGIEYRTHVQTYGWQPYRANGAMSGTSGQAKRLEAIQIRLTGQMAQAYDVWYRVHAQSYGWLGWAKNDSPAGTAGLAKRLEGIEIRVLPKGSAAPGQAFGAFVSQTGATPAQSAVGHQVGYRTHVQSFGWQGLVYDGQMSGTQGLAKRLEGIEISLPAGALGCAGGIEYRTHVQTYGWQPYRANGAMSGTSGQAKRLEAIQVRLTGEAARRYDVWYRVHAQTFGWMGWARNDQQSGTAGWAKRLEGIQILVLPKGSPAPGTTAGAFRQR